MSRYYWICYFLVSIWNSSAFATINLAKVEIFNASRVEKPDASQSTSKDGSAVTSKGNIKVFAGIAGDLTKGNCPTVTTTTCNSCGGENLPCNANRINPESYLRFEFQTDSATAFTDNFALFLTYGTNEKIQPENASSTLAINTTLYIEVKWSTVCAALGSPNCATPLDSVKTLQVGIAKSQGDSNLEESFPIDLYIVGSNSADYQYTTKCPPGVDPADSNAGYCWFEVERGDEKVYITQEAHIMTFNKAPGGVDYKFLRIFYAEGPQVCSTDADVDAAVTSASPYKDLTFTSQSDNSDDKTFVLDDPTITGLKNDSRYYFRFANVDEAGNVFYFSGGTSAGTASKQILTCDLHSKIPAEVVGLLDGKECFIATAAYGSSMAPQLNILREFRDRFLKTNMIGRWFVTKYYTYSPKWAQKIKKRQAARAVVRATLSPVISMAQWVILYGLKSFILLSAIGFCLGFFIIRRLIQDND